MTEGFDDAEVVARHEAAHALACIGSGRDQVSARIYKVPSGEWRGASDPTHLPPGLARIVVSAAGMLAQVQLGDAVKPVGHRPDLDRVHGDAADMSRAARPHEEANIKDMLTSALLAGSIASRFLDSIWDQLERVASELVNCAGENVDVSALVDVAAIRKAFAIAASSRPD